MHCVFPGCNCPLQVVNWPWCIFSRVVCEWVVEAVSGRGLGAGLGTVVYKACAFPRASPEEQRVKEKELWSVLSLFPFVVPTWWTCVPVETCPRISTQPRTPQRWGWDAPSPCWRQEETPKVSKGGGLVHYPSFILNCCNTKCVRGGKSRHTASSLLMCQSTALNPNQL